MSITSEIKGISYLQSRGPSPTRRPRLAVDMDEVIADALSHHLSLFNQASGDHLTPDDIRLKGIDAAVLPRNRELFDAIPHQPGFFADLAVIPGSRQAIHELSRAFDIFVTSAAMDVPFSFDDKFRWLRRHFPIVPVQQIVFCGNKEIIDADFLVDDRSRHFAGFRGVGILFTAPHNAREDAPIRADNWEEVLALLKEVPAG